MPPAPHVPPLLSRQLLRALLPASIRTDVLADLDHKYAVLASASGRGQARRWFRRQLLMSLRPALRERLVPGPTSNSRTDRLPRLREPLVSNILQDLRFAIRGMRNQPAFTVAVLATLMLGIGANTAIFSVIQGVLLAPLPYPDADRIVRIYNSDPEDPTVLNPASLNEAVEYRGRPTDGIAALAAFYILDVVLGETEEPQRLQATIITHDFAEVFRTPPLRGRTFDREEDVPGNDAVVLISEGLWERAFGRDEALIGRTIDLDGEAREVVGVMPAAFDFYPGSDVWLPRAFDVASMTPDMVFSHNQYFVGRLEPGVTPEAASAAFGSTIAAVMDRYPAHDGEHSATVIPLSEWATGAVRPTLMALLGAVGLLLLVACANVANLLLARSATRRREIAVRAALGAGRNRIVRQLLCESMLLAVLGGSLGVAVARWLLGAMRSVLPSVLPRAANIEVNVAVLGFALVVSLATGLLFGIMPSWRIAAADPGVALRAGGSRLAGGRHGMSRLLVIGEVALVAALLLGAGLMLRTVANLAAVDSGIEADGLLTLTLDLPEARYPGEPEIVAFYEDLVGRLSGTPGVEVVGAATVLPFGNSPSNWSIEVEGRELPEDLRIPDYHSVVGDYFAAVGLSILRGRSLTPADRETGVVISQRTADLYFADSDPLGQRIRMTRNPEWRTVVGVVSDYRNRGLAAPPVPVIYLPHVTLQFGEPYITASMGIAIRTAGEPLDLAGAVRDQVRALDPELPIDTLQTMDTALASEVARPRFTAMLLGLFAGGALLLGAVGVYGILAWSVVERTRELGLRLALGADRGRLLRMVLRDGLSTVATGLGFGLLAGFWGTRALMSTMLFETEPTDPMAMVMVVVTLLATALLAILVPARRATRIDPAIALRGD